MNKAILAVVIALFAIGGGAYYFMTQNTDDTNTTSQTETSSSSGQPKSFNPPKACNVLTLDVAKTISATMEVGEQPNAGASTADIDVSTCVYQEKADTVAQILAAKQATLLVRGAKTETGAESNRFVFSDAQKPAGAQDVSSYGEDAFWNPAMGQLNILKNDNWYILSVGSQKPSERTLDESKKLANALIDKL